MSMNMMRSESSYIAAPPPSPTPSAPPSPIPRAAGSRSAANQVFSEFLENSLNVPELALPEPYSHQVSDEINLRSIELRENYWVDRVLKSAREFGAFTIRCHGISAEELRALVRETERVFGILEERDTGYRRDMGRRNDNKEEIVWVRSGKERMDWAREYIGAELFLSFSEKIDNVASKLDAIAQQVGQVFIQYLGKQLGKRSHELSALSIYKYHHNNIIDEQSPSPRERHHNHLCNHVLSLHLPFRHCKYWVESRQSPFSFNAGPDVVVVTVGKQLESQMASSSQNTIPVSQASISQNSFTFTSPIKLDGSNYLMWKLQVLASIRGNDLEGYIDGSTVEPDNLDPDFLSWRKTDQLLFSWLLSSMTETILSLVIGCRTSYEELSLGEFKSVIGEMIHPPDLKASYSLELKCSSLNLKQTFSKTQKKISIADQILIGLIIGFLYNIFKFLWS